MLDLNKPLVFGVDISDYNYVDWPVLKNGPTEFVFIKSSEGGDLSMKKVEGFVAGAQSVNMPYTLYHFARPDFAYGNARSKAVKEADFFYQKIQDLGGFDKLSFPPILDYEKPIGTASGVSNAEWIDIFVDRFVQLSGGVLPILYSSKGQWQSYGLTNYKYSGDFWVAMGLVNDVAYGKRSDVGIQWGLTPPRNGKIEPFPNMDTTVWQYSFTGQIPGVGIKGSSAQDVNVMTKAQFDKYLSTSGGQDQPQAYTASLIGAAVLLFLMRNRNK